jgi:hypothetical protein
MLVPARLLELTRDPRIIAAAVANATTALMNGLSAADQKLVFMLFISSVRRSTFQKILRLLARSFNTASTSHPLIAVGGSSGQSIATEP